MHHLLLDDARRAVREALADVTRRTSAPVVVSVRSRSGSYRHADYLGGALLALLVLCAFLFHPEPFEYAFFPLEQAGSFVLGALLTSALPPLRRLLAGRRSLAQTATTASRAAFVELGIGRTPQRNGVLVYVSSFESALRVVCDVGIDEQALGASWVDAKKKLERAVRLDKDVDRFVAALKDLGPVLATAFPPLIADDGGSLAAGSSADDPSDEDDGGEEDEAGDRDDATEPEQVRS